MIIVSYDISNTKIRTRFSKHLKKYGRRLQFSVYEIKNSKRILQNVLKEIEYYYENSFEKTDSVVLFSTCEACQSKIKRYGYAVNEEQELVIFE